MIAKQTEGFKISRKLFPILLLYLVEPESFDMSSFNIWVLCLFSHAATSYQFSCVLGD